MPLFNIKDILFGLQGFLNGIQDLNNHINILILINADWKWHNEQHSRQRDAQPDHGNAHEQNISDDEDDVISPIIDSFKELVSAGNFKVEDPSWADPVKT